MQKPFDKARFVQQFVETVIWCDKHFSNHNLRDSLRTPPDPIRLHSNDQHLIIEFAHTTFLKKKLASDENFETKLKQLFEEKRGKLLLMYVSFTTCDGSSAIGTNHYIDNCDFMPWDSWVYINVETSKTENGLPDRQHDILYILCWIPYQLIQLIDQAIEGSADRSFEWLENTQFDFEFLDEIKEIIEFNKTL